MMDSNSDAVRVHYERIDQLIGPRSDVGRVQAVAEAADITPDYLWKLRKGKAPNVSAVIIWRLADALKVSPDYLMGKERTDEGMPIPEANLRSMVNRLNELPLAVRAQMARLVEDALGLLPLAKELQPVRIIGRPPDDVESVSSDDEDVISFDLVNRIRLMIRPESQQEFDDLWKSYRGRRKGRDASTG